MPRDEEFTGEGWELLSSEVRGKAIVHQHEWDVVKAYVSNQQRTLTFIASRQRGVSLELYVRRAVLALVAYDLGADLGQLLEGGPAIWGRDRQNEANSPWVITEMGRMEP